MSDEHLWVRILAGAKGAGRAALTPCREAI